jgi:hypothetical protein
VREVYHKFLVKKHYFSDDFVTQDSIYNESGLLSRQTTMNLN